MRWSVLARSAAAAAVLGLAVSGCGAPVSAGAATYHALDQQQQGSCDGVPAPTALSLLPAGAHVTAAVMCHDVQKYVAGKGVWTFTQVLPLPRGKIGTLVTALTQPDQHPSGDYSCTADLELVPPFVLTLSDGSRIRPGVPGDGCHPLRDAVQVFGDPATIVPVGSTRTTQLLGDAEVTSNCGVEAKSVTIWSPRAAEKGTATLPPGGAVSICYYRGAPNQQGRLLRWGVVSVVTLRGLWSRLPARQSSACRSSAPSADESAATPPDWLMVYPTPTPPYLIGAPSPLPIALIELGGCRRLVSPASGVAGVVPAAVAAQFAALADRTLS